MPMIQLTYISTLHNSDGAELSSIVNTSARNNKLHSVTGMLLYQDGSIMQTIEGSTAAVHALYARIQGDARHHGVIEMVRERISSRQFAGWSFGYRAMPSQSLADLPRHATLFMHSAQEVQVRVRGGRALTLLTNFGNDGRN